MKRTMALILAGGEGERLSILSSVRAKPAVPVRGQVPDHRLLPVELRQLGHRRRPRPDPVQPPLAQRPHRPRAAVGPRPEPGRREAAAAVHRARPRRRVVPRDRRRGAPEHERDRALVRRHDRRPRRRPHLQDGLPAVRAGPSPAPRRRDGRGPPRPPRRREPHGHPGHGRRRPRHRVAGEAEAAQERPRVDGRVRLHQAGPPALAVARTSPDFGGNVVPAMLDGGARVYGYRYSGYWQDVGTIQSYWEANLALLEDRPELDLYDPDWVIHTRSEERAPAKVGATAQIHRSLISHGCVIDGTVVNSVLSPGVRVDVGAVVRDSIVMFDSVIRAGAVVDRAILDKEVVVGQGAIVGEGPLRRRPEPPGARPAQHRDHRRRQAVDRPARRAPRPEREDRRRRPQRGLQEPRRQVRWLGRPAAGARALGRLDARSPRPHRRAESSGKSRLGPTLARHARSRRHRALALRARPAARTPRSSARASSRGT